MFFSKKKMFYCSYLKYTLESYVKQDYSLIYFHYGLTSKNKPSFTWLVQAYKAFDRNYKKNLKALYLVHPTGFLKLVSQVYYFSYCLTNVTNVLFQGVKTINKCQVWKEIKLYT